MDDLRYVPTGIAERGTLSDKIKLQIKTDKAPQSPIGAVFFSVGFQPDAKRESRTKDKNGWLIQEISNRVQHWEL
jgi:hypothetical protein